MGFNSGFKGLITHQFHLFIYLFNSSFATRMWASLKCKLITHNRDCKAYSIQQRYCFIWNCLSFISVLRQFFKSYTNFVVVFTQKVGRTAPADQHIPLGNFFFSLTGLPSPLVTSTQTFRQSCKVVPLHTMNAYTGSRSTAPPFLNLSTSWRWAVWRKQEIYKEAWRKLWNVDENAQLPTAFTSVQKQCLRLHGRAILYSPKTSINHLPNYTMQPTSSRPQQQPCPEQTVIVPYLSQVNRIHKVFK